MSLIRNLVTLPIILTLAIQLERIQAADDVDPRDLIDVSAAVCLEVPQIEARWSKLESSRLLVRLKAFPPVERFLSGGGYQKWTQMQDYVRRTTGKSLSDHLLGMTSESLVVAVYLPIDKAPQGVLIATARDASALKAGLHAWATLEPQQESKSLDYRGQPYVRRAKSAGSSEVIYYTIFGRTIAISDQERLIQQVIDLHVVASRKSPVVDAPKTIRESAIYQANRSRLPAEAAAFLYLNPRMWDRVVDATVGKSPEVAWFRPVFRQLVAVTAALRLDDEVVVDLVTDLGDSSSTQWRGFVDQTKDNDTWGEKVPAETILALSSKMDFTPLIGAWLLVTPDTKTEEFARGRNVLKSVLLGRDLFFEVLPELLRDWIILVVPAKDGGSEPAVDLVGRFELESGRDGDAPSTRESVNNALQFGLTAIGAMLSHQRGPGIGPVVVESETTAQGTIRTLSGLKVWKPSYTVTPQRLVAGTSRRALTLAQEQSSGQTSRLQAFEQRYFSKASQLVWLDSVALRTFLAARGDWIAAQLAPEGSEGQQRVHKHLSKIKEVAELFDAAFVTAGFDESHVRIVFGAGLDRSE